MPQTQIKVGNLTPVPYEECMCVPKYTTSLFFSIETDRETPVTSVPPYTGSQFIAVASMNDQL